MDYDGYVEIVKCKTEIKRLQNINKNCVNKSTNKHINTLKVRMKMLLQKGC